MFLAVPIEASPALTSATADLRSRYGLEGALRSATLHISLLGLGIFEDLPAPRLARLSEPGLAAGFPPFALSFTDAMSFPAKGDARSPLVLPVNHPEALRALTERLQRDLRLRGVKRTSRPPALFHITLLYDHRIVPERAPLPAPITIKVDRFALVRSLFGRGKHEELADYPLG